MNAAATVRYEVNRRAIVARRELPPNPTLVYVVGIATVVIGTAMAAVLGATSP